MRRRRRRPDGPIAQGERHRGADLAAPRRLRRQRRRLARARRRRGHADRPRRRRRRRRASRCSGSTASSCASRARTGRPAPASCSSLPAASGRCCPTRAPTIALTADGAAATCSRGDVLHVSGYSLMRAGSRAAALAAIERAREAGMRISVDPASAAPLANDPVFLDRIGRSTCCSRTGTRRPSWAADRRARARHHARRGRRDVDATGSRPSRARGRGRRRRRHHRRRRRVRGRVPDRLARRRRRPRWRPGRGSRRRR